MFDSLCKIFYSNNKLHQITYLERVSSPFTVRLPFDIKQFNHDKSFQAFFYYNQDLALLSEKIYSMFYEFMNTLQNTPDTVIQQFALASIIDEVHSTSSIEGIHSTHRKLKEILEGTVNNNHFSSIIKKYYLLTSKNYPAFRTCQDVREFYDEFAYVDIIADNPSNKLDGKLFRAEAVDVKSATGKIIHRGITPEDKIIKYLSDALDFLNDDSFPVLVRIAVFHYLFVYIHPFYDGNGRTARFISSCFIAQNLHYLIALRLSVTLKKRKNKYYSLLKDTDAEINCGDITPFIYGFLSFIADTIMNINRKLMHKNSQLQRFEQILSIVCLDELSRVIVLGLLRASVFYARGLSMNELMTLTGKSRNTIKKKIAGLPVKYILLSDAKTKFYKIDWSALRKTR